MKKTVKFLSMALVLVILAAAAASAEELLLPPVLEGDRDFYSEAVLDNIDRIQEQVAAYEAEMDMAELPDIDVYVFEDAYFESLEDYARAEAAMFGAIPYKIQIEGQEAWCYMSSELYDGEWYIVRNDLMQRPDGKIQETCWYSRTDGYAIADTGITIHIPCMYDEASASPDLGICRSYVLNTELMGGNPTGNPAEIDFIQKEMPENLGIDDLIIDYSTRVGSMTELVTVNGRCWYKVAGWLETAEGETPAYSVLYLREKDDEVVGVQFVCPDESNGADRAIMETTGF
ncbi:MAG: hypothetical protein MJ142_06435 [Clostridia bacterium]|nr:hypothetical protein [Clostridia bacterium]